MNKIEITFPVSGIIIPSNHGYQLYSAVKQKIGVDPFSDALLGTIHYGNRIPGKNLLELDRQSRFSCRVPIDALQNWLELTNSRLELGRYRITVGAPTTKLIQGSNTLVSPIVTFKFANGWDDDACVFQERLEKVVAELGISGSPSIRSNPDGSLAARTIKVKGVRQQGYSVQINELTHDDSIKIQAIGIGGRTRIGCGWFSPPASKI